MTDPCDRGIIVELVMEYEGVEVSVIYITSVNIESFVRGKLQLLDRE